MVQKKIVGFTISIQQPEYLPWLGFFNKIANADVVVLLDNVQFKKRYFENRVRIRNSKSWQWLGVPVKTKGRYSQKINEVEIDNSSNWQQSHLRALELNYKKSPYFAKYYPKIKSVYDRQWISLAELNIKLVKTLTTLIGFDIRFLLASDIKAEGKASDLILDICLKVGATRYLSGSFGKDYLNENSFSKEGVDIVYQDFHHPLYKQTYSSFLPGMSVVDLLFCEGEKSGNIIRSGFSLRK